MTSPKTSTKDLKAMLRSTRIVVRFQPFNKHSHWFSGRVWWVVFLVEGRFSACNGPHTYENAHKNRILNQRMYSYGERDDN